MNIVRSSLYGVLLLLLFGCSRFTVDDKRASMIGSENVELTAIAEIPENSPLNGLTLTSSIEQYLNLHTARVFSAEELSIEDIVVEVVEEETASGASKAAEEFTTERTYDIFAKDGKRYTSGNAAIIASDGYFLTAAHVIGSGKSLLVYVAYDLQTNQWNPKVLPFRKVFVDDAGDFAVIKADIQSPFYFHLEERDFKKGTELFTGGWRSSGPAKGKLIRQMSSRYTNKAHTGAVYYITSVPMVKGDSGSAVIDKEGRFYGVMSGNKPNRSRFAMMDVSEIKQLIETDRK